MLPRRKVNPKQAKNVDNGKKNTNENIVLELRSQINEEKEKRKNKVNQPTQESYKTPLVNKTLTKKNTVSNDGPKNTNIKSANEISSSIVSPQQKVEKKYSETVSGGTEPIQTGPPKLKPTGFTYFDMLAERDIMLSDSDS